MLFRTAVTTTSYQVRVPKALMLSEIPCTSIVNLWRRTSSKISTSHFIG